jgi:hypothetical protein
MGTTTERDRLELKSGAAGSPNQTTPFQDDPGPSSSTHEMLRRFVQLTYISSYQGTIEL